MSTNDLPVLTLMRDLLFYSKIRAAAAAVAAPVVALRDPALLATRDGRLLLVDLNQPDVLKPSIDWATRTAKPVVGFVSHVDTEIIRAAKAGGIDTVLPRSQFEKRLPELLAAAGYSAGG